MLSFKRVPLLKIRDIV